MPFYESQPTIYPLHRLLEEVLAGDIRVPRFQRPGTETTWRPQQRGDLLDSIYRGFPIGTVLLWATSEKINTLSVVGGATVKKPGSDSKRLRLVLDGHQRLSTLVSILGRGLEGYRAAVASAPREAWVFDVKGDDTENPMRERFKLLRPGETPGDTQIPMSIALDRVKLNQWVREHKKLSAADIRLADSLRDRLREYNIPVATLAAESLDVATETFKRINSSGTPMSDFHMVSALAYTDDFDPQQHFERVRAEYLEPEGWQDIDDSDTLRVCAGLVRRLHKDNSQHPTKLDISRLGRSIRDDVKLIRQAGESIAMAAKLLRQNAGVHGPGVLPYSWQLIVLAIEIGTRHGKLLTRAESQRAARWFWLTTYGGVFAGVNSAIVDRASRALSEMLGGGDEKAMQVDIANRVEEPSRFDFRSARGRACLLAMARQMDDDDFDGQAHRALATGSSSVHTLHGRDGRSTWYNLIVEQDMDRLRELREALRRKAGATENPSDTKLLKTILIQPADKGTVHDLIRHRRERLVAAEAQFVRELGLTWHDSDDSETDSE